MNIRFLLLGLLYTNHAVAYVSTPQVIGNWVEEAEEKLQAHSNIQHVPMHVFTVEIDTADKHISGNYCYVSNYGNKIDCNNPFNGQKTSSNHYKINFNSSFGGMHGLAELRVTDDDRLLWQVLRFPQHGDYSIPKHAVLHRSQAVEKYLTINKTKVFIFKEADAKSSTRSYLVLGDKVIVTNKKDNAWLQIEFKGQLLGWIKAADVD